jgi:hypothetical protein
MSRNCSKPNGNFRRHFCKSCFVSTRLKTDWRNYVPRTHSTRKRCRLRLCFRCNRLPSRQGRSCSTLPGSLRRSLPSTSVKTPCPKPMTHCRSAFKKRARTSRRKSRGSCRMRTRFPRFPTIKRSARHLRLNCDHSSSRFSRNAPASLPAAAASPPKPTTARKSTRSLSSRRLSPRPRAIRSSCRKEYRTRRCIVTCSSGESKRLSKMAGRRGKYFRMLRCGNW